MTELKEYTGKEQDKIFNIDEIDDDVKYFWLDYFHNDAYIYHQENTIPCLFDKYNDILNKYGIVQVFENTVDYKVLIVRDYLDSYPEIANIMQKYNLDEISLDDFFSNTIDNIEYEYDFTKTELNTINKYIRKISMQVQDTILKYCDAMREQCTTVSYLNRLTDYGYFWDKQGNFFTEQNNNVIPTGTASY